MFIALDFYSAKIFFLVQLNYQKQQLKQQGKQGRSEGIRMLAVKNTCHDE